METDFATYDCEEQTAREQNEPIMIDTASMKKCPFCAEQIQAEAIKCRYCGEFLDGTGRQISKRRPKKWYFATGTVVLALLCLGPFALPLVWLNPRYKPPAKVVITLIVIAITVLAIYLSIFLTRWSWARFSQLTSLGI